MMMMMSRYYYFQISDDCQFVLLVIVLISMLAFRNEFVSFVQEFVFVFDYTKFLFWTEITIFFLGPVITFV